MYRTHHNNNINNSSKTLTYRSLANSVWRCLSKAHHTAKSQENQKQHTVKWWRSFQHLKRQIVHQMILVFSCYFLVRRPHQPPQWQIMLYQRKVETLRNADWLGRMWKVCPLRALRIHTSILMQYLSNEIEEKRKETHFISTHSKQLEKCVFYKPMNVRTLASDENGASNFKLRMQANKTNGMNKLII